ncbi:hypothetical protein [Acidiphilium sp.]|uniref:phage adaptor protein n=1 Tax=Acidiphilium sp. TaxID=527 RepID=UPI002C0325C6|nr:hypothetical protein [Acidiphilium sp.]HQT62720.1 hypothetical protein [Acidiphilium sp.]
MATTSADPDFVTILPRCIEYAEQRIYRELDILNTRFRDTSSTCAPGSRSVTLPDTLMVCETLAVLTPAGQQPPTAQRNILVPCTHDFIDMVYPSDAAASQAMPQYFAMIGQAQALVGPCPDQAYAVEVFGTYRPAPLSSTNTTTPLTVLLPDLFMAASMIYMAGYQKNFGAQADDPRMAQSWEQQYQFLMAGAKSEEFRKKFESSSWTSMIPSTEANTQRG